MLSVKIAGIEFKNPVVTVSGTYGFGREYEEYFSPAALGAVTVKGLTLLPREGNPAPRIAETPMGMLNSVGLQNPGVEVFVQKELPYLKALGATVIANIAGSCFDDYFAMAERLCDTDVDMIEVNISCPNVKSGGVAFGTDPRLIEQITAGIKKRAKNKPVIMKLSPNVTDITEMARAAESAGADALSLINTLIGMRIDINKRRPILYNNIGGLSGPAVKPVAVRMIYQTHKAVSIPIIGMGGVSTWEDAVELIMAGASAVGVGTAMFTNPTAPIEIIDGLRAFCKKENVKNISELCGTVTANG